MSKLSRTPPQKIWFSLGVLSLGFCQGERVRRRARKDSLTDLRKPWRDWVLDEEAVVAWWSSRADAVRRLSDGSLVQIENFLPEEVAEGALAAAQSLEDRDWVRTAEPNSEYGKHAFDLSRFPLQESNEIAFRGLHAILENLVPSFGTQPTRAMFSLARYGKSDFIDRHDDDGVHDAFSEQGDPRIYSRVVSLVWYLTKDWKRDSGGVLVDLDSTASSDSSEIVPVFNSAVLFNVPRYHMVTPVSAQSEFRYSIFGWWYVLHEDEGP